jgi:glyoxylase-like metal-dependent hydrolase (beta-lactamase superfamily II)
MHPNHQHMARVAADPERALEQRIEVGRQSGVPDAALRRYREARKGDNLGIAKVIAPDRELLPGVEIETDLGSWQVLETPGHAPSHVCLHQPERRLLISGDHLLGRVSLYFDVGYTPDPVGEFLHSLDAVDGLDARLALAGHARPFTDVEAHIQANRDLVARRLGAVRDALATGGSLTAYEVARSVYGATYTEEMASWLLTKTRAWLTHLAVIGEAEHDGGSPERWSRAS